MGEERDETRERRPDEAEVEAKEPGDLEVEDQEGDAVQGGTLRRVTDEGPEE
jgi:hypothetical protein